MSRKGNCWDNAVVKSFLGSLKNERIKKQNYKNREPAAADVADYITAFYNRSRRPGHIGGISPEEFEAAHTTRRQGIHRFLGTPQTTTCARSQTTMADGSRRWTGTVQGRSRDSLSGSGFASD